MSRTCDRCNSGEFDEEEARCEEYSYAGGLLSFLCFDCRASWLLTYMEAKQLRSSYEKLLLTIDYATAQFETDRPVDLNELHKLVDEKIELEDKLRAFGASWFKRGADLR